MQSKERQKINGAEHDRLRREAKAKEKKESKPSSSATATAMLAQESKPRRARDLSSPSPSPSRDARHPVKNTPQSLRKRTKAPVRERSSSTSSSNGGVAIDD